MLISLLAPILGTRGLVPKNKGCACWDMSKNSKQNKLSTNYFVNFPSVNPFLFIADWKLVVCSVFSQAISPGFLSERHPRRMSKAYFYFAPPMFLALYLAPAFYHLYRAAIVLDILFLTSLITLS